jgi:hypothetical protein
MEISTEIRCSEGCGHCQFAMDGRQPPSLFFFPLSLKVLPTASSIRSRTHESSALPHTLLCGTHKPKRSMAMLLLHLTRPLPVRCARFVRPCMHAHRSFFFSSVSYSHIPVGVAAAAAAKIDQHHLPDCLGICQNRI